MARKTGVKIGMGTDAGTPFCEHGNSYIDEMKLMIKGGFTPMQAIVAATKTSAEILGVSDQYGTIAKGKIADFLVLNDNPLINIDTFRNISDIYKKGKRINREAL